MSTAKYKAVVVRVDSPGGSVGAAEEIYRAIKTARESKKKPIVCSLGSIAASGGLYAATACEKIVSNAGTLTGSIGVVLMLPNFEHILSTIGLRMNVIKSGAYKDAGSPFREIAPQDRVLLQASVDEAYEQFIKVVADSRSLNLDEVRKFADGRVILGESALKLGLVDQIGGLQQAGKLALTLAGVQGEPEMTGIEQKHGLRAIFEDLEQSRLSLFMNRWSAPTMMFE